MSPEFSLIDKLYSNDTFSNEEKNELNGFSVIHKRNDFLLKLLIEKNAYKELFEALNECGQSHLVKYLEEDGEHKPEFGGNWPLMKKESETLRRNYGNLIDLLDSRELVGLLYQTGVLNRRQRNLISSKVTTEEQNQVLLEMLRKGSLDGYWQTIRCLHLSNQGHVAKIFESGGVIVRIDANLQSELSNLTEVENSIVTEITNLLRNTHQSEAIRIWEKVQLNLVGAAAKHSVSLYFLCSNQGDIDRLEQMTSDGQLKKFLEGFFNLLMEFPTRIKVIINGSRPHFSEFRNSMKVIEVGNFIDEPKKTTIQCLPMELLDTILQKTYLWLRVKSGVWNGVTDSDIIMFLASVDELWPQRIQRKRLKKRIWSQLERIYKTEFEMYLSFRDCLRYLEEAMQVAEVRLTRQDLIAADFLTDLQIADQLRKKLPKEKQRRNLRTLAPIVTEILTARKSIVEKNICNNFIQFLRHTNLTEVLEEGVAIAKLEVIRPKTSNRDDWSREFSSRLNNVKERSLLKSEAMKTINQKLKDSGLEILDSFVDRGVIIWIWCKSQNAMDTLKALHKSKTLIHNFCRLVDEDDRNWITNDIHLEELSQLKIVTMSLRNLVISVEGELQMEETFEWAIGVTKLRSKIFVLGRFRSFLPCVVYIFDDQYPFKLKRKITFREIKSPTDFSSSEKNICLYIADPGAECLWKIRPPDEDKIEDGGFTCTALECPELSTLGYFRMTATGEGQILIIDSRNPILLFCESESALGLPIRIDFPDAIYRPEQVVKNLAGNFIFLHRSVSYEDHWVVSEVSRDGKTIIRQHLGNDNQWLQPGWAAFFLVDSKDRIFLSDTANHRLILLDSRLRYVRSLTLGTDGKYEESHLLSPRKMFYDGVKNQLIVAGQDKVVVYNFSRF